MSGGAALVLVLLILVLVSALFLVILVWILILVLVCALVLLLAIWNLSSRSSFSVAALLLASFENDNLVQYVKSSQITNKQQTNKAPASNSDKQKLSKTNLSSRICCFLSLLRLPSRFRLKEHLSTWENFKVESFF